MIDLNDMVIFAKVAELKGISPAARALDMPKSKVSRRMVTLEKSLGARLLERSTRSVNVTEAGNIYLQHCKRVVEEASSALESVNQLTQTPKGHLRISASVTCGQQLIAPHLGQFMQCYPDIEIEMDLSNRRVDMIGEAYDLVVRVGQPQDSTLVSKLLGKTWARLYASPDYLARNGKPATLAELAQHRKLVMTDDAHAYRWLLEDGEGIQHSVDVNPVMGVNDLMTMRTVLINGAGIALLPDYLADESAKRGRLVVLFPQWRSSAIPFYVLYPSHMGLTRKARVWVDFFSERLGKGLKV